jgi:hypothetical protein
MAIVRFGLDIHLPQFAKRGRAGAETNQLELFATCSSWLGGDSPQAESGDNTTDCGTFGECKSKF